ncbi:hypothetical protein POMI540_0746 [Schizosaccharomyces pombe]|uniref:Uncharacterized protein C25B8.20 n=1 Tax=Schizosaccharomyces pombe (strain 972 / ATCC 24843) TaxID=284812 RepID=YL8K_SCHPO|nr:uncharacterized protein SPAC25B8.20 [Schizosaccharomyces pombe]G2TRN5.1 RecName: Full=Uncharacterized protein C25B8.20 [Schizosaccharomyces pombe 972h-]CCD31337.1 sequence orphan [Schizosaccharomyces pombe]|eukprot:NP_001343127.1 uncharacterized protein SPAC25B8.20 [Schizosaccharomyces pombe]
MSPRASLEKELNSARLLHATINAMDVYTQNLINELQEARDSINDLQRAHERLKLVGAKAKLQIKRDEKKPKS